MLDFCEAVSDSFKVNNDKCWEPIQSYIDQQYDNYLNQESRVNRPVHIHDTRVHVCLYFIAPSGHGLKPLDIEFMRRLHEKVEHHTSLILAYLHATGEYRAADRKSRHDDARRMPRLQKGDLARDPNAQHQHLRVPRRQRRGRKQTSKEAEAARSIRRHWIERCSTN